MISSPHFDEAIRIAKVTGIEGEEARALRFKAISLWSQEIVSVEDVAVAEKAMAAAEKIKKRYIKPSQFPGLSENGIYDLMICGQRR